MEKYCYFIPLWQVRRVIFAGQHLYIIGKSGSWFGWFFKSEDLP